MTGRWLSKDPIGINGGLNQYVAFNNNPVNFVDPSGLRFSLPPQSLNPATAPTSPGSAAVVALRDASRTGTYNQILEAGIRAAVGRKKHFDKYGTHGPVIHDSLFPWERFPRVKDE